MPRGGDCIDVSDCEEFDEDLLITREEAIAMFKREGYTEEQIGEALDELDAEGKFVTIQ